MGRALGLYFVTPRNVVGENLVLTFGHDCRPISEFLKIFIFEDTDNDQTNV